MFVNIYCFKLYENSHHMFYYVFHNYFDFFYNFFTTLLVIKQLNFHEHKNCTIVLVDSQQNSVAGTAEAVHDAAKCIHTRKGGKSKIVQIIIFSS